MEDSNTIKFCTENGTNEVMRLDKDGMIYKGKRIEDGGEAYKAFLDVMIAREEERADRPVKEMYYWIAGYYKAIERYADHLETALARERESVNELSEANIKLRKALKDLISKLEEVHTDSQYLSVWTLYQTHYGSYTGPQYKDEFEAAKKAMEESDGKARQ